VPVSEDLLKVIGLCIRNDAPFQSTVQVTRSNEPASLHGVPPCVLYIADCGTPVIPPNATVGDLSSTTEGATAIIQCDLISITCTRISGAGQWIPDPTSVGCSQNGTSDISKFNIN
jgi:hypothetical protein